MTLDRFRLGAKVRRLFLLASVASLTTLMAFGASAYVTMIEMRPWQSPSDMVFLGRSGALTVFQFRGPGLCKEERCLTILCDSAGPSLCQRPFAFRGGTGVYLGDVIYDDGFSIYFCVPGHEDSKCTEVRYGPKHDKRVVTETGSP